MTAPAISRDELAEWLRVTERKIEMARAAVRDRERRAKQMGRRERATVVNLLASQRTMIEALETRLAVVRAELELAALPETCLRTDGFGVRCELPFGHIGRHVSQGQIRREWE